MAATAPYFPLDTREARLAHALEWTLSAYEDVLAGRGTSAVHIISFAQSILAEAEPLRQMSASLMLGPPVLMHAESCEEEPCTCGGERYVRFAAVTQVLGALDDEDPGFAASPDYWAGLGAAQDAVEKRFSAESKEKGQ